MFRICSASCPPSKSRQPTKRWCRSGGRRSDCPGCQKLFSTGLPQSRSADPSPADRRCPAAWPLSMLTSATAAFCAPALPSGPALWQTPFQGSGGCTRRKEIVAHILAAQLPLPGVMRSSGSRLPASGAAWWIRPSLPSAHPAVQHAVHGHCTARSPPAGHRPASRYHCGSFVQGHCLKRSLCALGKGTQILLCPFSLHL